MEFILITVQYSIKTLIYTMVKNYWVIVQNIMLYLMIGKMHKNTMKHMFRNVNNCANRNMIDDVRVVEEVQVVETLKAEKPNGCCIIL